jgi:hypothetical protein
MSIVFLFFNSDLFILSQQQITVNILLLLFVKISATIVNIPVLLKNVNTFYENFSLNHKYNFAFFFSAKGCSFAIAFRLS